MPSALIRSRFNKLRQYRDIMPRTMQIIQGWKERCSVMLKATPFMKKKKISKEVEILDDEMSARYEKIHGT